MYLQQTERVLCKYLRMDLCMKFCAVCLQCRPAEASRCYEYPHQTLDVWLQSLEQRDALCSKTNTQMKVWV